MHRIQDDETVGPMDRVEVSEPWLELRLVD